MTYGAFGKILSQQIRGRYIKIKNYGALFAQVTTVNVLTAEPTMPAKIDPSMAFGTIRYPAEPIVKPSAQKIRIASVLDIFYAPGTYR
jgi:hypothetical protein